MTPLGQFVAYSIAAACLYLAPAIIIRLRRSRPAKVEPPKPWPPPPEQYLTEGPEPLTCSKQDLVRMINSLPKKVRHYIYELETRCDPAGDIQTIADLREQVIALRKRNVELEQLCARCKELHE